MEDENKIVFAVAKKSAPSDMRQYASVIGESKGILQRLEKERIPSSRVFSKIISKALAKNEYGKVELDEGFVYVLPSSQFNLHTVQYPLVVIQHDTIIDIDEWWYTPFKQVLCHNFDGTYTLNLKTFNDTDCAEAYLAEDFLVKFVNKEDSSNVLYAIKTTNMTFNNID